MSIQTPDVPFVEPRARMPVQRCNPTKYLGGHAAAGSRLVDCCDLLVAGGGRGSVA